jgi:hypothetical protein
MTGLIPGEDVPAVEKSIDSSLRTNPRGTAACALLQAAFGDGGRRMSKAAELSKGATIMSHSKTQLDNHANQLNRMHPAFHLSRGASPEEAQRLANEAQAERPPQPQPEAKPAPEPQDGGAKR